MNELHELRVPITGARPTIRRDLPTARDAALMESLSVSARPGDLPLAVLRLCELIAELRERVAALEKR